MKFNRIVIRVLLAAGLVGGGLVGCGGDDDGASGDNQANNGNQDNHADNGNNGKHGDYGQEVRSDEQRVQNPQVEGGEQEAIVAGNTAFALDLYHAIADSEDNLFYSPLSISEALAMTYVGARGETEQEMADTLHFSLSQELLHPAFNWLDAHLMNLGRAPMLDESEPFELAIANAIWGQKGFHFEADFLDTLARHYGAGLRTLNFRADPEAARQTINAWVEEKTQERIQDLIPEGAIEESTRLVLTNAIYFKASWLAPFEEHITEAGDFHKVDGSSVSVDFMRQAESFDFAEVDGTKAISLPYDGGDVSMVIVLPEDIGEFEDGLDVERLNAVLGELSSGKTVNLTLPKFEFSSDFTLAQVLQEMGMRAAFGPRADFSGMNADNELFISEVIHQAFIAIDESGTEAAAATAVISVGASAEPVDDIVSFRADKPFIFLIRDNQTKSILFIGRVLDPTA